MDILIVNIHFEPYSYGGATIIAEQLAKNLHDSGKHTISSVSLSRERTEKPMIFKYQTKFGFPNYLIQAADMTQSSQYFAECFEQILLAEQPDIVHIHCIQSIECDFIDHIIKHRIPYIIHIHDFWWHCPKQFMITANGKYCNQEKIDSKICKKQCGFNVEFLTKRRETFDYYLKHASAILCPSIFMATMLRKNNVPNKNIIVNKNGVMPPKKIEHQENEKTIFGFVGGPGPTKGWDVIKDAIKNLPTDKFELHIVDAGLNENNTWLPFYALDNNMINIKVIPAFQQDNLDDFYNSIDVLLFPTCWKESFGMTVREATLRDVWVIASNSPASVEDLVDGENGTIIPFPPKSNDLSKAMHERIKKQKQNLPYKEKIHTFKKQTLHLEEIYSTITPLQY